MSLEAVQQMSLFRTILRCTAVFTASASGVTWLSAVKCAVSCMNLKQISEENQGFQGSKIPNPDNEAD